MKVKLRRSQEGTWGFVETYERSRYNGSLNLKTTLCLRPDGTVTEPYLLRAGKFEKLREVTGARLAYSVEDYLAAKKPIYSLLGSDLTIARATVIINLRTQAVTGYNLRTYVPKSLLPVEGGAYTTELRELVSYNQMKANVRLNVDNEIIRPLTISAGNRASFLRSRMESQ